MHCSDASREKRPQATGHEPVLWKKRRRDKNIKGNRPVFYLLFVPCEGGSHPFICPSSQSQHRNSLPAGITLTLFATPCRRAAVAGLLIETDRTTIGQLGTRFGGHLPAAVWGPIPIPMHLAFRGFGRDRASCWVLYCASLPFSLSLPRIPALLWDSSIVFGFLDQTSAVLCRENANWVDSSATRRTHFTWRH